MTKYRGWKWPLLLLIFAMVTFYGADTYAAGQSSENYSIERDVMVKAGGVGSSTNFNLIHSLSQSSITGTSAGNSYVVSAGFWNTGKCYKGDVNRTREIDIFDVVVALRISADLVPALGNGCEVDVDNNMAVDVLDVINILRLSLDLPISDQL